jgi:MFS family permease
MGATEAAQGGLFSISGRLWLILLMVQLANMLFGMTITLANLVLPELRGAVSATQDEISWVITLNLAATAVATPMTGWLAGRLGWRGLMFGTVLGFTLASLACGLATSLDALIIARVVQGAFGAPIMPLGQAILLGTFPKHLHSTALVMWGVGAVFGPVLGPILGAAATEAYNWRAAFFIIIPPGICALVCIWFALRDHTDRQATRFDGLATRCNARMTSRQIRELCRLEPAAAELLRAAVSDLGLSARAHDKVLRVARTVADLDDVDVIGCAHVSEAINYRLLDRGLWT